MAKDISATFDTADTPCVSCLNLQRTHANAAAEYLGLLREHQKAADPDSGLLEELVAAVRREIARNALGTHLATQHGDNK
jgi:hypothetical protein